jgi:NAD(P)-dependent dehydrogenase (short-subunit alcohol dehydrogenase family)
MIIQARLSVILALYLFAFVSAARRLKPKPPVVVLVTGCSSGIGKSTALEFAADKRFKVWATMRSPEKWQESTADNMVVAAMDVTSDESVSSLVARIIKEDGRIDVVVNNAGYGISGALELVTIPEAKEVFDVNVWGVVRVLQAVLPHTRKQKFGHAIQVSSTSGIRGIPCMEFYTGSKFALEGITDSMRYSLAAFNISVTNVNAGPVRTAFTDRIGVAEKGGQGSRVALHDETGYLQMLTSRMIAGLNHRVQSEAGQNSAELATLIVNLASLKLAAKRLTDVPFNIGSNYDSQSLLAELRRHPTGWGGAYNEILGGLPPLAATPATRTPPAPAGRTSSEEL